MKATRTVLYYVAALAAGLLWTVGLKYTNETYGPLWGFLWLVSPAILFAVWLDVSIWIGSEPEPKRDTGGDGDAIP